MVCRLYVLYSLTIKGFLKFTSPLFQSKVWSCKIVWSTTYSCHSCTLKYIATFMNTSPFLCRWNSCFLMTVKMQMPLEKNYLIRWSVIVDCEEKKINKKILNWSHPYRGFSGPMKQIMQMRTTELRIPTGGRQTSWLFTRMIEELNQALTQNNTS